MIRRLKDIYYRSSLATKIRYSYLFLLIPLLIFLVFTFYNLWDMNHNYEDMVNSTVVASEFSLDFKKDFDYETYLLIVGNKTVEESELDSMIEEAERIVAGLEEITEAEDNIARLDSVNKYLSNLRMYVDRIEENLQKERAIMRTIWKSGKMMSRSSPHWLEIRCPSTYTMRSGGFSSRGRRIRHSS